MQRLRTTSSCCVFAVFLFASSSPVLADAFDNLTGLHGCWQVEAEEINSIGEVLKQTGIVEIRTQPDGLAINMTHRLSVVEADGLYEDVARQRVIRENWSYDDTAGMLAISAATAQLQTPRNEKAAISADGSVVLRTFMFYHPKRGISLLGIDRLTQVSADEVWQVTEIENPFGDYHETYTATWRKSAAEAGDCESSSR